MGINEIVMVVIAVFLALGAFDRARGNRWGLGQAFTEGIQTMGALALVMLGIVSLAPVLAQVLIPIVSPLYRSVGADPASFANTILAVDMGGYALAQQMADSTQAGVFSWVLLGTTLGTTVVFTIPVALGIVEKEDHPYFARGALIGIGTIPIGCLAGGLAAGFPLGMIAKNLAIPVALSLLIAAGLIFFAATTIRIFRAFGIFVALIALLGLTAAGIEKLTGFAIIPGMAPASDGIQTVGTIAIVLAGAFPLVEFIKRALRLPLQRLGRTLNLDPNAMTGIVASLAHSIPAFILVKDMKPRGKVVCIAFAVGGSFVLGGHLGFVAGMNPDMVTPMIVGKLTSALSAALAAAITMREKPESSKRNC